MKAAAAKAVALTTAALLPVVTLLGSAPIYGAPETSYMPYDGPLTPMVVSTPTPGLTKAPERSYEVPVIIETFDQPDVPTAPPRKAVRQEPKTQPKIRRVGQSGSVHGVATWYCWPAFPSRCTVGFPSDGPYAAAGPELRRALGRWRGRTVYVNGVPVTLADWCACGGDHIIDVYHSTWITIPHPNNATVTW